MTRYSPTLTEAIPFFPRNDKQSLSSRVHLALCRYAIGPIADLRFKLWRRQHPGSTFAEFYATKIIQTLDSGQAHRTLGKRDRYSGGTQQSEYFAKRGRRLYSLLPRYGLKPDDLCLEYGCGSLRVGQHVMRYLDPAKYIGLDITDRFYNEGLELIDRDLLMEKTPRFEIICEESLSKLECDKPSFIYSFAVLHHVPPAEVENFLRSMSRLVRPGTTLCVQFEASDTIQRTASMSWGYPALWLAQTLDQLLPNASIEIDQPYTKNRLFRNINKAILLARL